MIGKFLNKKITKVTKNLLNFSCFKIQQLVKKKFKILVNFINFYG